MGTRDRRSQKLPSNWPIEQLPGLNAEDLQKLENVGIQTTLQLLQQGTTSARKQQLAAQLRVPTQYVNKWVALADLARLPSVGCQYSGLILHAGIASCAQLSQTPLHRLHQQILKLQVATMQRQDLCPSIGEMAQWVQQARSLQALMLKRASQPNTP